MNPFLAVAMVLAIVVTDALAIRYWRREALRTRDHNRELTQLLHTEAAERATARAQAEARTMEVDRAQRRIGDLLDRLEHLQGQMVDMKREGFVTVEHPVTVAPGKGPTSDEEELPSDVLMAIGRRGRTPAVREQLSAYARDRLRDGADAKAVAEEILAGADVTDLV